MSGNLECPPGRGETEFVPAAPRLIGVVTQYLPDMDFGFIGHPGGDVFVSARHVVNGGRLATGMLVEYTVSRGRRGVAARQVRLLPWDTSERVWH